MGLFDEMLEKDETEDGGQANINGVAIGVVKENWDEDHPGMIKAEISLGSSGKNLTDWIPVAVPMPGRNLEPTFCRRLAVRCCWPFIWATLTVRL